MSGQGQDAPRRAVDRLRTLVQSGAIERIELLRMPDEVMTRVNVTPESLQSLANYKVVFYKDLAITFDPVLSEASPKTSTREADLRWGLLFCDKTGREIGAVFVDKFGEMGYVNTDRVRFGLNIAKRLRQVIRNLR
jgi:hypothetical protein